jgi:hypothetical protein
LIITAALALGAAGHNGHHPIIFSRTVDGITVTTTVSHDVRHAACDGDSFKVSVRAVDISGAPVENLPATIGEATGTTNRHGVFRAEITPPVGAKYLQAFAATVDVGGQSVGVVPFWYSCPFDGATPISIRAFVDRDGDGTQGGHERAYKHHDIFVRKGGTTRASTFEPRAYRLDSHGHVDLTLDALDGLWAVCTGTFSHPVERTIVSVNGAPVTPDDAGCVPLPVVDGVETTLVIGVSERL